MSAGDGASADLRALRLAAADARDDVDLMAEAVRRAEDAATSPTSSEASAQWRLEAAADAVLALEAQTAADALRRAQAEVHRLEAIVVRLVGFTRRNDPALRRLHGLRDAIRFPGDAESEAIRDQALRPWNLARAALLTDADAALPEVTP